MNVLVTGILSEKAAQRLNQIATVDTYESDDALSEEQVVARLDGKNALVCLLGDKINAQLLDKCPDLKLVANVAVGYDNIKVADATARGVLITNTPGVLDNATADLAFGLLLSAARRIGESDRFVRAGKWQGWSRGLMLGQELNGKTLGIIGMGRIGKAFAKRAQAFGLKIIYTKKSSDQSEESKLKESFDADKLDLDSLCERSDFISIHCPLTPATHHLVGSAQFAKMKSHCVLVNTSRGAVIDEAALVEALSTNRIAAAGLDVFEREPEVSPGLLKLENVVITPHIGSASQETRDAMDELAISGLISAFENKCPKNAVNPEAWDAFVKRLKK